MPIATSKGWQLSPSRWYPSRLPWNRNPSPWADSTMSIQTWLPHPLEKEPAVSFPFDRTPGCPDWFRNLQSVPVAGMMRQDPWFGISGPAEPGFGPLDAGKTPQDADPPLPRYHSLEQVLLQSTPASTPTLTRCHLHRKEQASQVLRLTCGGHKLNQGSPILVHKRIIIYTDASLLGWGDHLRDKTSQGKWTTPKLGRSINFLKLQTIFLTLMTLAPLVKRMHILVYTDNRADRAYVNSQDGVQAQHLFRWKPIRYSCALSALFSQFRWSTSQE